MKCSLDNSIPNNMHKEGDEQRQYLVSVVHHLSLGIFIILRQSKPTYINWHIRPCDSMSMAGLASFGVDVQKHGQFVGI